MASTKKPSSSRILFGKNVRKIRKSLDWTQQELAMRLNIYTGHVSDTERGKRNITIDKMHEYAHVLGVDLKDLLS